MPHYDLAVIGSGSGNSLLTPDFDDARVVVIDDGLRHATRGGQYVFGGTCLNVGCIPTKMFVHPAEVAQETRHAHGLGVDAHVDDVRWADIRGRIFGRIDRIADGGLDYRRRNERALMGRARFTGDRTLDVVVTEDGDGRTAGENVSVTAENVVIATGSRPVIPPALLDAGPRVHTSDTIMRVERRPERLLIVGGGYVAAEFAHIFAGLGTEVTLVVRGTGLLTHLDTEISSRYTGIAQGAWDVRLGTEVRGVEDPGADNGPLTVRLSDGGTVEVDQVLVATGRRANSDGLGLEHAGVVVGAHGLVQVDDHQRTTAPGVWALGDVSSWWQLKHVANQEARVVAHNIAHPDDQWTSDHRFVPAGVFTTPQIATVGLTEAQARGQGLDLVVSHQAYGDTAYGWALEDSTGLVKLIADRGRDRLVGAHLMGPHATSLIQPLIQAMSFDQPVSTLARGQYWIHPAMAEVVENALLGLA